MPSCFPPSCLCLLSAWAARNAQAALLAVSRVGRTMCVLMKLYCARCTGAALRSTYAEAHIAVYGNACMCARQ